MILEIVKYGHPVLRQKGARVEKIDAGIKQLIADMLETVTAAKGVGLAAQQVGRALQLTVLDVRGVTDRPSTLQRAGKEEDVNAAMPLVLINPEVTPIGESVPGPEGCLSFPEIFADISRPAQADVRAMNEKWEEIQFRCGGLLARAIQHELDHLNGILFIDRMLRSEKEELKPKLDDLLEETKAALKAPKVPADSAGHQ
jgi:peptide deformylase